METTQRAVPDYTTNDSTPIKYLAKKIYLPDYSAHASVSKALEFIDKKS